MLLSQGGEGVVLKNLNFRDVDTGSCPRAGWVKVKKQLEVDCLCFRLRERSSRQSDYGIRSHALSFRVMTEEGPLPIAKVSNLPWELSARRSAIYDKSTNEVRLDVNQYGRVGRLCGVRAIQRMPVGLVHPRIDHWQKHLSQEQCVYSLKDIENVRKGVTGISLARIVSDVGLERQE